MQSRSTYDLALGIFLVFAVILVASFRETEPIIDYLVSSIRWLLGEALEFLISIIRAITDLLP